MFSITFMAVKTESYVRELLFGRWYREDIDEQGGKTVEYAQLSADGSFEFTFVSLDTEGDITEQVIEYGDWGLVADIHFTLTKGEVIEQEHYAADLNNADNYHAYRVLVLDHQTFQYQHIVTEEIYVMRRIVDVIGHC